MHKVQREQIDGRDKYDTKQFWKRKSNYICKSLIELYIFFTRVTRTRCDYLISLFFSNQLSRGLATRNLPPESTAKYDVAVSRLVRHYSSSRWARAARGTGLSEEGRDREEWKRTTTRLTSASRRSPRSTWSDGIKWYGAIRGQVLQLVCGHV